MLQSLRVYMNSSKRAKYRARAKKTGQKLQGKNNRAKIEGKTQGKGKGKTTNYYFPNMYVYVYVNRTTYPV